MILLVPIFLIITNRSLASGLVLGVWSDDSFSADIFNYYQRFVGLVV